MRFGDPKMGAKIGRLKKRKKRTRFSVILASEIPERHQARTRTLLYLLVLGVVFGSFFVLLGVIFRHGLGAAEVANFLRSFWGYLWPSWGISLSYWGCLYRKVQPRSPQDRSRSTQDGPRSLQDGRRSPKVDSRWPKITSRWLKIASTCI